MATTGPASSQEDHRGWLPRDASHGQLIRTMAQAAGSLQGLPSLTFISTQFRYRESDTGSCPCTDPPDQSLPERPL